MIVQKALGTSLKIMTCVLLLSGCASTFFPDFADDTDVVIDEGGKVEIRKVKNNGILVADKENAVYEDEDVADNVFVQDEAFVETVTPAKTVSVEAEELNPVVEDNEPNRETVAQNLISVKSEDMAEDDKTEAVEEKVVVAENEYVPTMHYMAEIIHFDNGSGTVDYKFYKNLKAVAKIAKDNNAIVSVYGYASSRTRNTDPASHKLANFKVSAERAESVAKVLRKYGVKSDRIITHALSDSLPMYQEVMPEGERLNRRVEIYLTY